MCYGMFVVWYEGTVSGMYSLTNFAWWYGILQYIRSVGVAYVVRMSSVTTLYIEQWKLFKTLSHADRQTDKQTDRFAIAAAETQLH